MEYPKFTTEHKSLMVKYFTKELFEELKSKKTANGFTILDVVNSGVENPDSGIGAYAGDEESYRTFGLLFDPIIEEYHGFSKDDMHKSNLNPDDLNAPNPDPDGEYIVSTRIRVGRNLDQLPLGPAISDDQRNIVEQSVSGALNSLEGKLSGKYYPLNGMSQEDSASLIADHLSV